MFNVLLLRFERVGRLGKIVGRRIGTEFVKHAERETSGCPDEQDNDRQGPQSGPKNRAFRRHCTPLTPGLDPEELNMEPDAERWLLQLTVRIAQALLGRLESGRKVYSVFGEGLNPLMAEDA